MGRILSRISGSDFFHIFNRGDELSRGRCFLLMSSITSNIAANLFGGTFYSGFLLANGINLVGIGIIGFIPNLCVFFSLLSPSILSKLPKRKSFLVGLRCVYYFFLIIAITVLPYLNLSQTWIPIALGFFLFIAHGCNALSNSGWFVWHKKLLVNGTMTPYFSWQLTLTGTTNCIVQILAAVLADHLAAGGNEMQGMVIVRLSALIFAAIDLICLASIKEYEYESTDRKDIRIRDIVTLPFKAKKYLATILMKSVWSLVYAFTSSYVSVFVLKEVGISYTFIYIMSAVYALFLFLFAPLWKKLIYRWNMFRTFAVAIFLYIPSFFLYALLTPDNYLWLYPIMMCLTHFSSIGINLAAAGMPYANMPQHHEESFASFQAITLNVAVFLGSMIGTVYMGFFEEKTISLFGRTFTAIPTLMLITCAILVVYSIIFYRVSDKLNPDD